MNIKKLYKKYTQVREDILQQFGLIDNGNPILFYNQPFKLKNWIFGLPSTDVCITVEAQYRKDDMILLVCSNYYIMLELEDWIIEP